MSGVLCYSLPDSGTSIKKYGSWSDDFSEEETFFVSNFNNSKKYFFKENKDLNGDLKLKKKNNFRIDTKEEYKRKLDTFIEFCQNEESRKVILSRNIWTELSVDNPILIFDKLVQSYPKAFVYLVQSDEFGCWVGATPEKLLRGTRDELTTMALAGSRSVYDRFDWTAKEVKEQEIVTKYIAEVLHLNSISFVQSECSTIQAGNIEHLSTEFKFKMENKSPIDLAIKLHPTPAVSGLPKLDAIQFIQDNEGYDRGLYTGIIGWSSDEETQLFVNLRCAQLFSNGILSYVGGGITKDSDADMEWKETEFKSQTLLSVIQKM